MFSVLLGSWNLSTLTQWTAIHYHNTKHTISSPIMFVLFFILRLGFSQQAYFSYCSVPLCSPNQHSPLAAVAASPVCSQRRKEHSTCNKKEGRLTGLVMSSSLFFYVTQRRLIARPETSPTDSFRHITSQKISGPIYITVNFSCIA